MWSTSKDWKRGNAIKTGPTEEFFQNKRKQPYKRLKGQNLKQLKIKNYIMGYRWTFGKIRENFVSDPQLNMI